MFVKIVALLFLQVVLTSAVTEKQVDEYLDVCIDSKHHKDKPGPETDEFKHCSPWKKHACCKANTTKHIANDGTFSLYRMKWNQCDHIKPLSAQCKSFLEKDTCFYECSPNMSPWIVEVTGSKTRRQKFSNVPLCASDCDAWFEACKDDYTCSDNWGNIKSWNWTKTGNECKQPCKTFKDYYNDPITFCNKLFNYSFKYTSGKPGENCLVMWPNDIKTNALVARKYAKQALSTTAAAPSVAYGNTILVSGCLLLATMNAFGLKL